jgi:hypothetical protein
VLGLLNSIKQKAVREKSQAFKGLNRIYFTSKRRNTHQLNLNLSRTFILGSFIRCVGLLCAAALGECLYPCRDDNLPPLVTARDIDSRDNLISVSLPYTALR